MKKIVLGFGLLAFMASCGSSSTPSDEVEEIVIEESNLTDYTIDFQWTAYKTAERVGVNGTFNNIRVVNYNAEGTNPAEKVSHATIEIDGSSVNTEDPARDNTLNVFFFEHLEGLIKASFGHLENGTAPVTLELNGVTATKEFTYSVSGNNITIEGNIDLIQDFQAQKAYDTLHEQCNTLHEGVTGTDVAIKVNVQF